MSHGSVSLQLFPVVWIFLSSLGVISYDRWVLSEGHKNYFKETPYLSVFNLFLTQWIMAILLKGSKPDNFEPHNSLKLSFTNIWGLHSNFVECEYFLESNSPDILPLCETNLDDSIDSGNFSVTGYPPLIWKDSITHMHGFAVYVKEGLPFPRDYLRKTLQILTYAFDWLSLTLCMVFDSFSSNMDEVVSINPSINVFIFGDFNIP